MATKRSKSKGKWTQSQIKNEIKRIQEVIEQQTRLLKKRENFTSVTPEDIERKPKRVNPPMIVWQSRPDPTPPGGKLT